MLEAMLGRYYDEHGWDARGVPTDESLERLGLTGPNDVLLATAAQEKAPSG